MRVTWKLDPPVCQWTIIIVSVPKMSPKTGSPQCSSSEPLPSGVEGSCRVGCRGCLLSSPCLPDSPWWSQGCTSPLSAGGAARAQVLLFSLLCGGGCRGSAGSVLLCLHSGGAPVCGRPPGDRPIHVPRPEAVSPLLGVSGVSSVLPFYLTEYLITTLNVLFSLFTFP